MHYAQANPSRSNLPRDPVTGRIKPGPGRKKGQPNVLNALAKDGINRIFEELGGVEGMVEWALSSPKNLYAFYVHIYPKLLAAQVMDAAAAKLAQRPRIGRIECVIVDPKDDYRTTFIDDAPCTSMHTADRGENSEPGARLNLSTALDPRD